MKGLLGSLAQRRSKDGDRSSTTRNCTSGISLVAFCDFVSHIRRMREGISRNSEAQELDQGVDVLDSLS